MQTKIKLFSIIQNLVIAVKNLKVHMNKLLAKKKMLDFTELTMIQIKQKD
jgi:hypothetical protein